MEELLEPSNWSYGAIACAATAIGTLITVPGRASHATNAAPVADEKSVPQIYDEEAVLASDRALIQLEARKPSLRLAQRASDFDD
jgi:hypothetical protein